MIKVYPIGTSVFVNCDIPGVITGIRIQSNDHISYDITYWNNGEPKLILCEEFEVSTLSSGKLEIGFKCTN